jgi:hypothetical protein
MRNPIDIPDAEVDTMRKEDMFWKHHEVIRISSHTHMRIGETALLFYINFSNEFVDNEIIIRKSYTFLQLARSLRAWLEAEFVSWRGPRCFDNPDENRRVFGDRFVKGK